MRAKNIVDRLVGECRSKVHSKRYESFADAVVALLHGQRLSLTSLGRAMRTRARPKHAVKRVDRLLGNWHLWRDSTAIYAALARKLVRGLTRVVVAVDWTQLPSDLYALTATVAFCGRGLPIFSIVRPQKELGSPRAHDAFLDGLRAIFPDGCRPILVADAGFKTPFFQACEARGFDFVIRLRGNGVAETWDFDATEPSVKLRFEELFGRAGRHAQCLGARVPHASTRSKTYRLVLASRPKGRIRRRPNEAKQFYRRRALEPWLLATTLENEPAEQIVRIYATRMQIEETFRDIKDPRFGWALDHSRTRCPRRFNALLLIAAVATAAVTFVGATAENNGRSRTIQVNTERSRRVLSLYRIGNSLLLRARAICFQLRPIQRSLRKLHRSLTKRPRIPRDDVSYPLSHDLFCSDCGDNFALLGWPQ